MRPRSSAGLGAALRPLRCASPTRLPPSVPCPSPPRASLCIQEMVANGCSCPRVAGSGLHRWRSMGSLHVNGLVAVCRLRLRHAGSQGAARDGGQRDSRFQGPGPKRGDRNSAGGQAAGRGRCRRRQGEMCNAAPPPAGRRACCPRHRPRRRTHVQAEKANAHGEDTLDGPGTAQRVQSAAPLSLGSDDNSIAVPG